ncbi:unnamed protein product, partial [Owenia fusiformis]
RQRGPNKTVYFSISISCFLCGLAIICIQGIEFYDENANCANYCFSNDSMDSNKKLKVYPVPDMYDMVCGIFLMMLSIPRLVLIYKGKYSSSCILIMHVIFGTILSTLLWVLHIAISLTSLIEKYENLEKDEDKDKLAKLIKNIRLNIGTAICGAIGNIFIYVNTWLLTKEHVCCKSQAPTNSNEDDGTADTQTSDISMLPIPQQVNDIRLPAAPSYHSTDRLGLLPSYSQIYPTTSQTISPDLPTENMDGSTSNSADPIETHNIQPYLPTDPLETQIATIQSGVTQEQNRISLISEMNQFDLPPSYSQISLPRNNQTQVQSLSREPLDISRLH